MILAALALVTATPDTVVAQIAAARPGDTLVLSGTFTERLVFKVRNYAPAISIDATRATFVPGVFIARSSGIHWRGGIFHNDDPKGYGIQVDGSSDISVTDTQMSGMGFAISFFRSHDLVASRNRIEKWKVDGIRVFWSQHAEIADNVLLDGDPYDPVNHHPDAIQLASGNDRFGVHWVTSDVRAVRNTVRNARGQGITAFHHDTDDGYDRIVFEDNDVLSGYPHGVSLFGARSGSVSGNKVRTAPGVRWAAAVKLGDNVGVRSEKNKVEFYRAPRELPPSIPNAKAQTDN